MNKPTPWDSIPVPAADFNVVRVPGARGVSLYWGRDIAAQYLLLIELKGDFMAEFRRDAVLLRGVDIDLRNGGAPGIQRLVLTLTQSEDCDLFLGLTETLIGSLREISSSTVAYSVALNHLKRWKAFLAGKNPRVLSPQEVLGLFGELHTLRTLYLNTLSQADAIGAWSGPERSHQDFIFETRAIEVKSLSGRERSSIRVSSEDQLESIMDNLFLWVLRLSDAPDAPQSLSLNELVALIEGELEDGGSIEAFSGKLASVGYAQMAEYDYPSFAVKNQKGYRVSEDFPRLVRSALPTGVMRVSYDIALEEIEPFSCQEIDMFRRP